MPTKEFNQLTSTLLTLPSRQRAQLAQKLWISIEGQFENAPVEKEALAAAKRRDREITDGKVRCKTHGQVMKAAYKAIGCSR